MASFYILSKIFFLKCKELSVASITKKEYRFAVHFLQRFIKSLNSISDDYTQFVEGLC